MISDRLRKLAKYISMKKELTPQMPDFDSFTDKQLDDYIKMMKEEDNREHGIFSLTQALEILRWQFNERLISEAEHKVLAAAEEYFWNNLKEKTDV